MKKGYPVTREPFVPEILKQTVNLKTFKSAKYGDRSVGLTFAADGLDLVNPECLQRIQEKLIRIFKPIPYISKELENRFARNTIAISFAEYKFQVGNSCQEFVHNDRYKVPDDAYFTYQKLSENLQVTYYNENGVEFLAGICYYPVTNGKPKLFRNDNALFNLIRISSEEFPLQDREKSYKKTEHNVYGRYCTKAGKRVAVDCSKSDGTICHKEFNHDSKLIEYHPCIECLRDAITYKWVDPKKNTPVIEVSPIEQPVKSLEEQIITKCQALATNSSLFDNKVDVFNRTTGILLEDSKCPKITELSTWLDANPEFNVCNDSALIAHLSLGSVYDNRIGGNDAEAQVDDIKMDSKNMERDEPEKDDFEPQKVTQEQKTEQEKIVQEFAGIEISELTEISQMSIKEHQLRHQYIHKIESLRHQYIHKFTAPIHPQIRELAAFMIANPDSWEHITSTNKWNVKETEVEKTALIDIHQNSESPSTSKNAEYSEASTFSDSSKNPSPASSTESLMEGYDKIESTTNYNKEFDAEVINFN